MILNSVNYPARVQLTGQESFTLAAGQRLLLRHQSPAVELLDAEVPAGKAWNVVVTISVEETGA